MRKFSYLLVLAFVVILSSACAKTAPEPVTYSIEMTEYAFTPSTVEAKVGQEVTLNLVNKGALQHEIMFGREAKMVGNHSGGYVEDMFEKGGVKPEVMLMEGTEKVDEHGEDHSGFMVVLPKTGDQGRIKFSITEDMVGEWEMGCFELDGVHYTSGMIGKFIVRP